MKVLPAYNFIGHRSNRKADEIGVAMQKASASAEEFGVSFEWLGTYIATVSEKTRQAPEVIGTAFNSLMARMHTIKEKGYNEEDATRINDVAKALGTLGIELIDEENKWRSMSDIMLEIAAKWDTLDAKQKAYISTTMAGTRQQNTFLALMNDMAKGVEGGSRAFELYSGAMGAAGTAAQKYSVYMESVEAASNRFEAALENLYSLMDANWMKGAYDGLAAFINLVASGTDAMKGLNLTIPATVLALGAVVAVIAKIVSTVNNLSKAMDTLGKLQGLASILNGGTIGAVVAAVAGIVTLVTTVAGLIKKASEIKLPDYSEQLIGVTNYVDTITPLINEFTGLSEKQNKTTSDTKRMDEIFAQLSGTSYTLQTKLEGLKGQYGSNSEAVQVMNEELQKQIDLQNSLSQMDAFSKFGEQVDNLKTAYEGMASVDVQKMILDEWNNYIDRLDDVSDASRNGFANYLTDLAVGYDATAFGNKGTAIGDEARQQEKRARDARNYVLSLSGDIQAEIRNIDTIVAAGEASAAAKINDAWEAVAESLRAFTKDSALLGTPADVTQNLESFVETVIASLRDSVDGNMDNLTEDMLKGAAGLIQTYKDIVVAGIADIGQDALPDNFSDALVGYSDELFAFIQKLYAEDPAAVTEDMLESVVEMFTGFRDSLAGLASSDGFSSLMEKYEQMLEAPESVSYDKFKEVVDGLNSYISEYNQKIQDGEIEGFKIDLLPDFDGDEAGFEEWKQIATDAIDSVGDAAQESSGKMSAFEKHYTSWLAKAEATAAAKNGYRDTANSILTQSVNSETGKFDLALYKAAIDAAHDANSDLIEDMTDAYPMFGKIYNGLVSESEAYSFLQTVIEGTAMAYETERKAMVENLRQKEELDKAKKNGFVDQIAALDEAAQLGQKVDLGGVFVYQDGLGGAREEFNSWSSDMQESFAEAYPGLYNILAGVEDVTDETEAWAEELEKARQTLNNTSYENAKAATQELLKQAEAAKELADAKANNYIDQIKAGQDALANGFTYTDASGIERTLAAGEEAFRAWWASLSDDMREGITATYPEIAKMAVGFGDVTPSIAAIGAELDRVRQTSLKEFNEAITGSDNANLDRVTRLQNAYNGVDASGNQRKDGLSGQNGFQAELLAMFNEDSSGTVAFVQNNKELMALKDGYVETATSAQLFADATYKAKYSSVEATAALLEQQKAAKQVAEEEKSNYSQTRETLASLLSAGNNDATLSYWQQLPEDIREGFASVYPEAAELITQISEMTDGATQFSDAIQIGLDRLETAKQSEFFKSQREDSETAQRKEEASAAADNRYFDQLTGMQGFFTDGSSATETIEALREYLYSLYTENAELAEGFKEEYGSLWNIIFGADADMEEVSVAFEESLAQCQENLVQMANTLYEAAYGSEAYRAAIESIQDALDTGSEEAFIEVWNSLGKEIQNALLKSSDAIKDYVTSLSDMSAAHKSAADAAQDLTREGLAKEGAQLVKQNKIWKESASVISSSEGTISDYLKSVKTVEDKLNDLALAQTDLATVMDTTQAGTNAYKAALADLESYCGFAINSEYDLAAAAAMLSGDTDMASASVEWLLNAMIALTGVNLNPSTWIAQLQALAAAGDDTALAILDLIAQLGAVNGATVSLNDKGKVVVSGLGTANNGTRRRSSRSGGGGGGGSRRSSTPSTSESSRSSRGSSGPSEIERYLDILGQIQTIQSHRKEIINLNKAYYESRGEIQGVLKCIEYEKKAIQANTATIETNLTQIESLMEAKRREVDAMSTSAEGYSEAADDLKSLQDRHMEYSKQLLQNRNDLEALNKEIKEWQNKIRQMEIDLRNLILSAIEDREELKERMLQGTIETEDTILEIIKARYEEERDEILDTADARRAALEEEKQALQEQLNARKEARQEEEKLLELKRLEAQYARITADPTRRKEALELQKKIKDLRDEIAWDAAEKEIEAQQEAIDKQIQNTEDYADYVKQYYEDLLENPRNFISEVQKIMAQSDEEILQWLKDNSEEFKNSTDAARIDIANGWQDMLNDMHGAIVTYWDEIEDIISKGDDAIIQFLMDNSADYKAAGKLQAEAYVDAWKEQLEALRNAYKDVAVDISSYDYQPVAPASGSSGDYSGSEGSPVTGPTGPTGGKSPSTTLLKHNTWSFTFNGQRYSGFTTRAGAEARAKSVAQEWYNRKMKQSGGKSTGTQEYAAMQRMLTAALNSIKSELTPDYSSVSSGNQTVPSRNGKGTVSKYASGGLNTSTGPAWLDGTPQKPERILSPYQTELFEDMIATLHALKTINVPTMPAFGNDTVSHAQPALTFGDVIIQVDKLDDDTDYDELAEKFFDHVLEKSGRVQSVGGIRLSK